MRKALSLVRDIVELASATKGQAVIISCCVDVGGLGKMEMNTVEALEQACELLRQLGYQIREESLAGSGGGGCEIHGRKTFFLDLDLGPDEQLDQVLETLHNEPKTTELPMSAGLRKLLTTGKTT
jgi:hypothetical protein